MSSRSQQSSFRQPTVQPSGSKNYRSSNSTNGTYKTSARAPAPPPPSAPTSVRGPAPPAPAPPTTRGLPPPPPPPTSQVQAQVRAPAPPPPMPEISKKDLEEVMFAHVQPTKPGEKWIYAIVLDCLDNGKYLCESVDGKIRGVIGSEYSGNEPIKRQDTVLVRTSKADTKIVHLYSWADTSILGFYDLI